MIFISAPICRCESNREAVLPGVVHTCAVRFGHVTVGSDRFLSYSNLDERITAERKRKYYFPFTDAIRTGTTLNSSDTCRNRKNGCWRSKFLGSFVSTLWQIVLFGTRAQAGAGAAATENESQCILVLYYVELGWKYIRCLFAVAWRSTFSNLIEPIFPSFFDVFTSIEHRDEWNCMWIEPSIALFRIHVMPTSYQI